MIAIVWSVHTYGIYKFSSYGVQRMLTIIPYLKALYEFQLAIEFLTCPWDSDSVLVNFTLFAEQILSILTIICYATIVNGIFYVMCRGWGTTISSLNRVIITNLMMIGGAIYLLELAKSYSSDSDSTSETLFELVLTLFYFFLFKANIQNLNQQIVILKNLIVNDEEFPAAMLPSIELKLKQLYGLRTVCTVFYMTTIIISSFAIITSMIGYSNQYMNIIIIMIQEAIDIANFSYFLRVFKPRRNWPAFYGIGVDEVNNNRVKKDVKQIHELEINQDVIND